MKRLLLLLILSCFTAVGFAQIAADGDYRSVATGDWTNPATWQVRSAGSWTAATTAPSVTNNVYLQTGHIVDINAADVYCKDLHWGFISSTYGSVRLNTNNLNVSGKVRVYTGHAAPIVTTGGGDGVFYSAQSSSTATNATQFTSSTSLGYLKFIGDTRDITVNGEWTASGTVCYGIFALNPGQTGTLNAGMKFRGLDFVSGNIVSNNSILAVGSGAGNGDVTIQNGAKFTSSRASQVITLSSSSACRSIDIKAGGTLELTNSNPEINCTTFINNGTVVYSSTGNQNFAKSNIAGASSLTDYSNLTVATGTSLTLPETKTVAVNGMLDLLSGKLVIPYNSVLEIVNGNTAILGGNSLNYIHTAVNGAAVGTIRMTGLSTSTLIPVGTATHYTPITLNPTTISNFDINVFAGATADGTPNGTAVTAAQKLRMVDAVWNINRTAGAGDVAVTLGWDNALEGTDFANFANAQIGIAGYNGTTFGTFSGSGNAAANTATLTTSTFSPFIVGEANTTLPLTLLSFEAKERLNSVLLTWQTTDEVNLKNYVLQHKVGNDFVAIQTVPANNKAGIFNYSYTHLNPLVGVNYYRLVGIDLDGTTHPSKDKWLNVNLGSAVNVYPNPVNRKNITVSGVVKGDVIRILNIQGQVVASKSANGNQIEEIDVQHIQNGTYILSIENGGKVTSTKKVIKI